MTIDTSDWKHSPDTAREVLAVQVCPVCGRGPWKSPLNHIARKHGIDRRTMRDACNLTLDESVVDPELRERFVEHGKQIDMSKVNAPGKPRAKQQWTRRGRDTNNAIIAKVNQNPASEAWSKAGLAKARTPEARAKHDAALREFWAALPAEERERRTAHLGHTRTPEQLSEQSLARWDKQGRQPCGTRAAYRRGCRCTKCREAYLAYRRANR